MSLSLPTTLSRAAPARADAIDLLAQIHTGKRLSLQVCYSADGPVPRGSVTYYRSYQAARHALKTDRRQQRRHP